MPTFAVPSAIDRYWLPLGGGGHSVRLNVRMFEWFSARLEHRDRSDLYYSAVEALATEEAIRRQEELDPHRTAVASRRPC
jgi:hypothetical protein